MTALEQEGVCKKDILAVPIETKTDGKRLFDTMHVSTGDSLFDLPMILGAFLALFGSIYGFKLEWGPVLWGIIGGGIGFGMGVLVKLLLLKKKKAVRYENEAVILVACLESKTEKVKQLLYDNGALGVSLIKGNNG